MAKSVRITSEVKASNVENNPPARMRQNKD